MPARPLLMMLPDSPAGRSQSIPACAVRICVATACATGNRIGEAYEIIRRGGHRDAGREQRGGDGGAGDISLSNMQAIRAATTTRQELTPRRTATGLWSPGAPLVLVKNSGSAARASMPGDRDGTTCDAFTSPPRSKTARAHRGHAPRLAICRAEPGRVDMSMRTAPAHSLTTPARPVPSRPSLANSPMTSRSVPPSP
jgi:hypothetical protein